MKKTFRPKIVNAASQVEDAGMILEVFQDAVDEVEIPEGYNWDYKIDQLENKEPAGQIFIMTDDDQPVAFFTFALTKDGEPLDIVNDRKLYTKLVDELKSKVEKLGDMSEFVSKPKQETIALTSKVESHMKRTFSASDAKHKPNPSKEEMLRTYIDDLREFTDEDIASWIFNGSRVAYFWFEDGTYRLVVEGDEFSDDEYWSTDEKYWGDEELIEYNDIELSADELYSELLKYVPDFDRNFYGKRVIFDAYPEFYD